MATIIKKDPYGKLDLARLISFESGLVSPLPSGYRQYLLQYNGGRWDKNVFHISDVYGNSIIDHMFGLHNGPTYEQLDIVAGMFRERIKKGYLPFAGDQGGNKLCIALSKRFYGKIYFWDHETEDIVLVSGAFEDFIDGLFEIPAPSNDVIEIILTNDDASQLNTLIHAGYDIESLDEYGRSLIERAAIKAKPKIIECLYKNGASIRDSLSLASRNAEFFEKHKAIVDLIKMLMSIENK